MSEQNTLEKYMAQLRRVSEHRLKSSEAEIRREYKRILKDLQEFLGVQYATYAEDDTLTYAILQQKLGYANFLQMVEQRLDGITPAVGTTITEMVEDVYTKTYTGMVEAVQKTTKGRTRAETYEALRSELQGLQAVQPSVIKAIVDNPIAGLTLKDTLERNRKEIIYNIKRAIGTGLASGDRYSTMAKRIAEHLDGNYKKAVLIARTEAHRVREQGANDSATNIDEKLKASGEDLRMVKIWRNMGDGSVRSDHRRMEGQTRLEDEDFELPDGSKAPCPGSSGVARQDCNCRCYVEHELMTAAEYKAATGKSLNSVAKNGKIEKDYESAFAKGIGKSHYDDAHDIVNACTDADVKAVWEQYEGMIGVASSDWKKTAHHRDGEIYLNIQQVAKGNSYNAPYETLFHESGHGIDYYAGKKYGYGIFDQFSAGYKDGLFPQTIEKEVKGWVDSVDKQLKAAFKKNKTDVEWLKDNGYISYLRQLNIEDMAKKKGMTVIDILSGKGGSDAKHLLPTYSKKEAYRAIQKEVGKLSPVAIANLSDILEGATKGKIVCGYGHGKTYWSQRDYGKNQGLAREAFTEIYSSVLSNGESLKVIQRYLPQTYSVFVEMITYLAR